MTPGLVLCHGVFDIVHPGHLEHFRQAKRQGNRLMVAVVADGYVRKGPGRPVFNECQRIDFLAQLRIINDIAIVSNSLALPALAKWKPEVYCKGPDYADPNHPFAEEFRREKAFVESYGGRVMLTTGFTSSSSRLIRILENA